ncbi:MAG: hypothetical protein SGARI_006294 [Bacillariaceae sp.]
MISTRCALSVDIPSSSVSTSDPNTPLSKLTDSRTPDDDVSDEDRISRDSDADDESCMDCGGEMLWQSPLLDASLASGNGARGRLFFFVWAVAACMDESPESSFGSCF